MGFMEFWWMMSLLGFPLMDVACGKTEPFFQSCRLEYGVQWKGCNFISIHYSTLSCIEVGTPITKFCIKDEHTSEAFCED